MFECAIPGRVSRATDGAESRYWRHAALQMWSNVPEKTPETLNIFISHSAVISRIGFKTTSRRSFRHFFFKDKIIRGCHCCVSVTGPSSEWSCCKPSPTLFQFNWRPLGIKHRDWGISTSSKNSVMSLMSSNIFIWSVVFDWCACARLDSLKLESTPVPTVQTCHQGSEKCGVFLAVHRYPNTVECLVDLWCFISSGWAKYAGSHMFSRQLQDKGQMWLPEYDLLTLLPSWTNRSWNHFTQIWYDPETFYNQGYCPECGRQWNILKVG